MGILVGLRQVTSRESGDRHGIALELLLVDLGEMGAQLLEPVVTGLIHDDVAHLGESPLLLIVLHFQSDAESLGNVVVVPWVDGEVCAIKNRGTTSKLTEDDGAVLLFASA